MVLLDARGHRMCGLKKAEYIIGLRSVFLRTIVLFEETIRRDGLSANAGKRPKPADEVRGPVPRLPRRSPPDVARRLLLHELGMRFARHVQPANRLADAERGAVV